MSEKQRFGNIVGKKVMVPGIINFLFSAVFSLYLVLRHRQPLFLVGDLQADSFFTRYILPSPND